MKLALETNASIFCYRTLPHYLCSCSTALNEVRDADSFFFGNVILQANRYNRQILNILFKSFFTFQLIFLNPFSHIKFSASFWYPSNIIKSFFYCPLASLYVLSTKSFFRSLDSKYLSQVLLSISPDVNILLLTRPLYHSE